MQIAHLETGAIVPLEHEEYCVNCGAVEPSFHMIDNELHCEGCYTLAKANHIQRAVEVVNEVESTLTTEVTPIEENTES